MIKRNWAKGSFVFVIVGLFCSFCTPQTKHESADNKVADTCVFSISESETIFNKSCGQCHQVTHDIKDSLHFEKIKVNGNVLRVLYLVADSSDIHYEYVKDLSKCDKFHIGNYFLQKKFERSY